LKANNNDQWCYGVTKDSTKNDLLLVCNYNSNLPESLLGVTLKYKIDGLIYKSHNTLNELLINRNDLSVETIKSIETTIEMLKTTEDCANCKDKEVERNDFNEFRELVNEIVIRKKYHSVENLLFEMNTRLNKEVLCEGCKREETRKLADKCGNREIAKFLYECRLNAKNHNNYIQWIPFDEFKNIEYLAKGGFVEVHKATWIYEDQEVVLERIHNSNDKIIDILKEVNQEFIVIITITLKWK